MNIPKNDLGLYLIFFDQINDLSEEYDLGVKALSLKEIIVESMIIPDHIRRISEENL